MAQSDEIELKNDVVTDESVLLATGFAGLEVDGAYDASVGANEQEHTEDNGREEVDDRTLDLASKVEGTDATVASPAGTATTEELQNALIPLELSKIEVVTPPALAEDGAPRELGEHEAPDSTDPEKMSDEDGLMGVTTKDGPEDLPVKEYLDATVVPVLRDGLRILAKERPVDPYTFLGDYIKAHREAT